ncbi:MAG: hypothetical protein KJZ91_01355 [Myxococcales bacterium]|nr:hypothetical protein [Myxococcales bacterium]
MPNHHHADRPRAPSLRVAAAAAAALGLGAAAGDARADAFCDHARAVAAAERATLVAPEVFASFGYVEQPAAAATPTTTSDDLRLTLGVRYSLGELYQGAVVGQRADAACRRHRALARVQALPQRRALAARARVLDAALAEAARALDQAAGDLAARRATAQEVTAIRLRVDQLRAQAVATARELATLPAGADDSLAGALAAYQRADAEVERHDGRLRGARAWDVSVRVGYDRFLDADDESPYFAVVAASFDLGWLAQRPASKRAAAARQRLVRDEPGATSTAAMRALLAAQRQRAAEAGVLADELEHQLDALRRVGGEDGKRFRQTVWFEWVAARAEHAYLEAHAAALGEVLGESASAAEAP